MVPYASEGEINFSGNYCRPGVRHSSTIILLFIKEFKIRTYTTINRYVIPV
jgi:hypothetical protein